MKKVSKKFVKGARLRITHEYGHDFTYYGNIEDVDEKSVTIRIDGGEPLKCVPTEYGNDHFECEDGRFLDFDVIKTKDLTAKLEGEIGGCPVYFMPELSLHGLHVMRNESGSFSVLQFDHTRLYSADSPESQVLPEVEKVINAAERKRKGDGR